MQVSLKGETGFISYFNLEYRIVEINFRFHLITRKHFYGVHFLNKSVKSFVIFHHLFQPEEETILIIV